MITSENSKCMKYFCSYMISNICNKKIVASENSGKIPKEKEQRAKLPPYK